MTGQASHACTREPAGFSGCFDDINEASRINIQPTLSLEPEEAGIEIDGEERNRSDTIELEGIVTRIGPQSSQMLENELLLFLQKTIFPGADIYMLSLTWLKCREICTSAVSSTLRGMNLKQNTVTSDKDLGSD